MFLSWNLPIILENLFLKALVNSYFCCSTIYDMNDCFLVPPSLTDQNKCRNITLSSAIKMQIKSEFPHNFSNKFENF